MASQLMLISQLMPLGCLLDYVRQNRWVVGEVGWFLWFWVSFFGGFGWFIGFFGGFFCCFMKGFWVVFQFYGDFEVGFWVVLGGC